MKKRVFVVHCWDGYPEYCWYPYIQKELSKKGFEVKVPAFPDTDNPKQDAWVTFLDKEIGTPDENLFLVGHSIGAATILRYLEKLGDGEKIGGAVFVAGFADDLGFEELKNFFTTEIPFEQIKDKAGRFVAIHSDDDPFVPLKHGDIFKEKLGAKLIVKHGAKHFSGPVDKEKSCIELPEVVNSILKISR